jgi:hypothetical protein
LKSDAGEEGNGPGWNRRWKADADEEALFWRCDRRVKRLKGKLKRKKSETQG